MTDRRLLRLYRIIYQVFRLFTGKIKEEIEDIEKELNESAHITETTTNKA
jgi:hypothetical protein